MRLRVRILRSDSIIIACLVLIISSITICACQTQDAKKQASSETRGAQGISPQFFEAHNVEWMTIMSGMQPSKVLYQENGKDKIQKFADMLNQATRIRPSMDNEVRVPWSESINWEPLRLGVRLTNGQEYFITLCYDSSETGTSNPAISPDRFIIKNGENGRPMTAYSNAVIDYLAHRAAKDMPQVAGAVVKNNKSQFEIGESISITGDGCYEPAVLILLEKWEPGSPPDTETSFRLAQPKTHLGRWEWHSTIRKEITTIEGKHIMLDKGTYRFNVIPHSGLVYCVADFIVD